MCHSNTNYQLMIESNWMILNDIDWYWRLLYNDFCLLANPVQIIPVTCMIFPTFFGRNQPPQRNKVRFDDQLSKPSLVHDWSELTLSLLFTVWIFMEGIPCQCGLLCKAQHSVQGLDQLQTFSFPLLPPHHLHHHLTHAHLANYRFLNVREGI